MQPRRPRNTLPSPFLSPPNKPKDINTIESVPELLELLRRTNQHLSTCSQMMRESLETRKSKIEARLEYVSTMTNVTREMKDTHISPQSPIDDVSMEDAVFVAPYSSNNPRFDPSPEQPQSSASTSSPRRSSIVQTKEKIASSPIRTTFNRPNGRGIRIMDHETSIRLQQEEAQRRLELQRAHQEALSAKQRRLDEQTEEAARVAAQRAASQGHDYSRQEDAARQARILAFMSYRPDSDEEEEEDSNSEFDDDAMEALLEAEFEDGTKGQAIVDPDGLSDLIRVDPGHLYDSQMGSG